MPLTTILLLTAAITLTPPSDTPIPRRIDVDCDSEHALRRALVRVQRLGEVELYLHGICEGHFRISRDGITLRGATPDSGLAAPANNPGHLPVLEVVNSRSSLQGLVVRGGEVGIHVHGWEAELLLNAIDVHDQTGVGIFASRGAQARLTDAIVRDGSIGISAESDAELNLQNVVVSGQRMAVIVSGESFAAINDSTIENNIEVGLNVGQRSDVNVLGGSFRENGGAHVNANDWSSVTLLYDVVVGSASDGTLYALSTNRNATIASFSAPELWGNVSALVGGSIRLGNTVVHGDLTALQFADAHVRNAEITGSVNCIDGADVICSQTTVAAGTFGCPSPTCGAVTGGGTDPAIPLVVLPAFELPRPEPSPRARPQR